MPFTVVRQFTRFVKETSSGCTIEFGHANTKLFRDLNEARQYATQLTRNIKDEKDENVYIRSEKESIELWSLEYGKVISQQI